MRRLPDDFNVNILLPGAVWLLISVLIGQVSVSRLETDAITVVLFVVISLVVFAVPMAVYMEYRKKVEQWPGRKARKNTAVSPSGDNSSDSITPAADIPESTIRFPQDFPDALKGSRTMVFMDALRQEGFFDAEYRPQEGCNATLMAFIADSIATICNIHRQWKIFGDYWHLSNMRQLLDAKNRRGSKADKEDIVIGIFQRVAEADGNICNTDAYRSWVKNVQG